MDHKMWLPRKKSSEKTILSTDKANLTPMENEEILALLADKEELEKELKILNDKLVFILSDCNAKEELLKKQIKVSQVAVAGLKKAEAEMLHMKQDLDESMQQRLVYEERVVHLDDTLKCMQQLHFVREEKEQRIHDAVMKSSKEFEQSHLVLEQQLSENSKRLAKSGIENSHLNKPILAKENLIEDLKRQLAQVEADHNALAIRLESTEKDNASLKYEVRVLEKELDIQNEEREFNRHIVYASHKQHLESARKIARLESECQRLHLLVRKRLPGPPAMAKMKNEGEMLGQCSLKTRKKKLNSTSVMFESSVDSSPETTIRRITTLTEQLCAMEEETKTLKESLSRKTNEVQFSRTMLARTASKLLQLESQIEESSKGQVILEQPRSNIESLEFSLASMSSIGSDDKVSCGEPWASLLISELENFRSGKQKESLSCISVGSSDINLIDDFVEMEKLAVTSVAKAPETSHASLEVDNGINSFSETGSNETTSEVVGKVIVPVFDHISYVSTSNQENCFNDILKGNIPGWLQDVVKVVLEQNFVTHKNPKDILEDIRLALRCLNNPNQWGFDSSKGSVINPSGEVNDAEISSLKRSESESQTDMSKSISKIIELIEGINMPAEDYDNSAPVYRRDENIRSYKNLGMPTSYMVRVFQWKTSELSNVLQQFIHVCYDLLNGKGDYKKFTTELTTALDWIMNHCFSLQDVSSMRDAIKKQFDWDETSSENEAEIGMISDFAGAESADKSHFPREHLSHLPPLSNSDDHDLQAKDMQYDEKEECNFKDKVISSESAKEVLGGRHQSATDRTKPSLNQFRESEKTIVSVRSELPILKESNGILQHQIRNHTFVNSDLDTQHTDELKKAHHKVLALEVELENKNHYCKELETRYVELQLQLESMTKEWSIDDINQKDKPLQTDWEITAASEKLAECQETILNVGRQLKAMAAPKNASLFDSAIATYQNKITNTTTVPFKDMNVKNGSSLLDHRLSEDDTKAKVKASDKSSSPTSIPGSPQPLEKILVLNGLEGQDDSAVVNSLAIVPAKKSKGRTLWKKLLGRKKKAKKKKPSQFNT